MRNSRLEPFYETWLTVWYARNMRNGDVNTVFVIYNFISFALAKEFT